MLAMLEAANAFGTLGAARERPLYELIKMIGGLLSR
jgi:hypothetical protein